MKKSTVIGIAALLVLAVAIAVSWRRFARDDAGASQPRADAGASKTSPASQKSIAEIASVPRSSETPAAPPAPTTADKMARIAKIKRDYDEIRAKASADYTAAGASFPGGLNAFLRQLALLEREKRADFAKVLTPRELEDLEMSETTAGNLVQRLIGATKATEEQRRAVFRLQLEYEDRFALTFDLTPPALLEREAARQQAQERIRGVLGDELFGAWLSGEGEDYATNAAFAARNNLPAGAALELWRAKNEYTLRRLEFATQKYTPEQQKAAQTALAQQIESRVLQIVGPSVLQDARKGALSWLPKR